MNPKAGVMLIAAILIGAGVFVFVTYKVMDATHIGTTESENCTLNVKADSWINLSYVPDGTPSYMQKKANGAYNGTVISAAKVTWPYWGKDFAATNAYRNIYVDYATGKDGAGGAVRNDTKYLQVNYTTRGAGIRPFITPAAILCAIMAIVVTAAVMTGGVRGMTGGKKGGGRKSFP